MMNWMMRGCIAILSLTVCLGAHAQVKDVDVEVRVVDSQGKAVPGARVAQLWQVTDGNLTPAGRPESSLTTDAAGVAKGQQQFFRFPVAFMAVDEAGSRGGLTLVQQEADLGKPITIRIEPLRTVTIRTSVAGWTAPQAPALSGTVAVADRVGILMVPLAKETAMKLPPGEYDMHVFSFETAEAPMTRISVGSGRVPVEPVTIALEISPLAKAMGQEPPPLKPSEAVGLPPNFQLSDLKGKWVLLEIWGHW
jgi:hypothetical protein